MKTFAIDVVVILVIFGICFLGTWFVWRFRAYRTKTPQAKKDFLVDYIERLYDRLNGENQKKADEYLDKILQRQKTRIK